MLHRFLETIQNGEVQSLLEIASKLGISPDMVLQMATELTKKGYLQEMGTGCDLPQKGCSDCSVYSGCQISVRNWALTDKGKAAIESK